MGWALGTEACIDVWNGIREYVPPEKRTKALCALVVALQNQDWDCSDEIEDEWPEARIALSLAEQHWRGWNM